MTRVERIVARARQAAVARIATRLRRRFPELDVAETPAGVTLSGRGLGRRMLEDARLRDLAGQAREDRA